MFTHASVRKKLCAKKLVLLICDCRTVPWRLQITAVSSLSVSRMNPSNGTWYILETNYDHWKAPLFVDDRRTPVRTHYQALLKTIMLERKAGGEGGGGGGGGLRTELV